MLTDEEALLDLGVRLFVVVLAEWWGLESGFEWQGDKWS